MKHVHLTDRLRFFNVREGSKSEKSPEKARIKVQMRDGVLRSLLQWAEWHDCEERAREIGERLAKLMPPKRSPEGKDPEEPESDA
jgi:hypothetical protein